MLRWSAAIAVCAGSLSLAGVQAQQLERREAQPFQQQELQQLWEQQKAQMRARTAGAIQQLRGACAEELRNFCGTVSPGEGRLLLCMQAHEDKLGRGCEMALLETSRSIGREVRRVERFAEACWNDIQVFCRTAAGSVTQCVVDNRSSLSPQCQAIIAATRVDVRPGQGPQPGPTQQPGQAQQPGPTQQPGQAQPPGQAQQPGRSMAGLAIYSTDGMKLGEVTGVKRRPDGSVELIEADIGSPLGLGTRGVLISPNDLRWKGDHIELQMGVEQVRSILQGQKR
jgi:Golgi apparatus protein 1